MTCSKKNYFIKNIPIKLSPLYAALILSGCMSNDEYKANSNILPENEISEEAVYVARDGLTGKVIASDYVVGAKVCFDANKNGICNSAEASENTFSEGRFSFTQEATEANNGVPLIAEVKVDGDISYVLSSNQVSIDNEQIISPFTTLVLNEQFYNPYLDGSSAEAITYLSTTKGLISEAVLNGKNYLSPVDAEIKAKAVNLVLAYTQAYALEKTDPFKTIANVVDEVVKNGGFNNITVSSLVAQDRVIHDNGQGAVTKVLKLENANVKLDIVRSYKEETSIGATFDSTSNKIIAYSKWHNKLSILDTSDPTVIPTNSSEDFYLNVPGGEHATITVDGVSGVSEQKLDKVVVSDNGSTIYSMVKKAKSSSKDKGVGIYSSDISSVVPSTEFARETDSKYYYNYPEITDIFLSKDSSKLIASGDDSRILIFNADDLANPVVIDTAKRPKSIAISDDNVYVFAGVSKNFANPPKELSIYNANTKNLVGSWHSTDSDFDYPVNILTKGADELFVSVDKGTKIYHLNIADKNNIVEIKTYQASEKIKKLSLTEDKKHLIVALQEKQVEVFSLERDQVKNISFSDNITAAFNFSKDDNEEKYKLAIITAYPIKDDAGEDVPNSAAVRYFDLTYLEDTGKSDASKLAWQQEHRE